MVSGRWCSSWLFHGGRGKEVNEERDHDGGGRHSPQSPHRPSHETWDAAIPAPDLSFPLAATIVCLCACACFLNSLSGDFVFDDSEAIVNNNDIRSETPISNLFRNDFWGTRLTHPSSHKSYRPLTVFSFRLNYRWGGLNPVSYHAVNIFLHCLASVMSLRVFMVVFGPGGHRAAALAAILFATHPVHTEAVSGIVGRADLVCALFVFVSLLSYVKAVQETKAREKRIHNDKYRCCSNASHPYALLALMAVSTGIAMLCKEVGITALGLCSAYDVLLAHGGAFGRLIILYLFREKAKIQLLWKNMPAGLCRGLLSRHLVLLVTGIVLLASRWVVMGSTVPKFMKVDNPASFLDNMFYRVVNYHYIYSLNVLLLLLPLWLCFDWSMGCVPLIQQATDLRLLCLPLLWICVGLVLRRGVISHSHTSRCVLMGMALGIVPFLPASNVFFRVGFVIAERVLYIPAAGFCVLVVVGMRELRYVFGMNQRVLQVFYCLLVAVFILRCQQRSQDWLTEKQLFRSGLDVCPLNAKVHYNMGKVAADTNDVPEAVRRYREALRLNTDYDQAMNNLANILKDQGQLEEALQLLQHATLLRPDFAAAWMNLGIVQASLGDHQAAETSYLTALTHRAVYPDCLYNLGNLYLEKGEHELALSTWTNATNLKPTLTVAWTNMLILLDAQGHYQHAITTAHKALKYLPSEPALHFNLANTLGKLGQYDNSEAHFRQATQLDPSNGNYWANLGVLYHRWRKYDLAEQMYTHALKLNPSLKSAHDNLSMLMKTLEF
ncbi:protein O-mannosyl-transferase TMTC4-like isoform X2 [Oratosquilla oratoria]|uniref:protein O-mannosyl-transferase TMTC4-like isoform X2 n=1 Tax=Oratosquilla oratoria TaxID=337810 RepID=UPI003F772A8A